MAAQKKSHSALFTSKPAPHNCLETIAYSHSRLQEVFILTHYKVLTVCMCMRNKHSHFGTKTLCRNASTGSFQVLNVCILKVLFHLSHRITSPSMKSHDLESAVWQTHWTSTLFTVQSQSQCSTTRLTHILCGGALDHTPPPSQHTAYCLLLFAQGTPTTTPIPLLACVF